MLFYSIPIFPPKKQTESDWDQRSADYKAPCAGGDVGKAVELLLLCLARRRRFWETWYKKKSCSLVDVKWKWCRYFFFSFLFLSLTVHWCFLGCMWLQRQISSQCPFFFLFSHLSLQLSSFQVCFCRLCVAVMWWGGSGWSGSGRTPSSCTEPLLDQADFWPLQ